MTKTEALLETLQYRWLTPLEAARSLGVFALSQRCGEFRRAGHTVDSRWVDLPSGSRVKEYRVTKLAGLKDA